MSGKRPGIKGKTRRSRDKAHARHEQLERERRKRAIAAALKRQADFESVPTSVDYDNDCAP